jgi:NAD-dependent SIR2 family protein deacetylase
MDLKTAIAKAGEALSLADAVMINAGAGMGVDSGLPDFRGNQGFWNAYPPIAERGISFFEMANPRWFDDDPELAWAFYGHRLNLYRKTEPHRGYKRLLEIAGSKPGGYFVFTSNVDGQFQKAGYAEERIVECHGSIHHFQCTGPCGSDIWDAAGETVIVDEKRFTAQSPLPHCPRCGALARPNILMFGDWHWVADRTSAQEKRLSRWLRKIMEERQKLVVVEIGAGQAVPTVRIESENAVSRTDGKLIRINPRDYRVPSGHISIPLNGLEGIEAVCRKMRE